MRQESDGFLRFAPEATAENGSHQRSRLPARLLCAGGARSAMSEATAEFSTGDLPPTGTRSPLKGVLCPGGARPAPNSPVGSDIASRAPLGHSNRSEAEKAVSR